MFGGVLKDFFSIVLRNGTTFKTSPPNIWTLSSISVVQRLHSTPDFTVPKPISIQSSCIMRDFPNVWFLLSGRFWLPSLLLFHACFNSRFRNDTCLVPLNKYANSDIKKRTRLMLYFQIWKILFIYISKAKRNRIMASPLKVILFVKIKKLFLTTILL